MSLGRNARASRPAGGRAFRNSRTRSTFSSAFAQSDSTPKWDLFVGYQWHASGRSRFRWRSEQSNALQSSGHGQRIRYRDTYNFDPHWGGELDFGYNWDSSNKETTVSGGPRFMWRTEDVNYFLHALVSYNRLAVSSLNTGANGIGAILGGGMDLPISKRFAWRSVRSGLCLGHVTTTLVMRVRSSQTCGGLRWKA